MVSDCCCESIQLGRCFGSNGVGLAQCDSFLNDTLAYCHLFDNSSITFECLVQDDCDQIGNDWIAFESLFQWVVSSYSLIIVMIPAYCFFLPQHHDPFTMSVAIIFAMVCNLLTSILILASSQVAYQTTLYVVIGFIISTMFFAVPLHSALFGHSGSQEDGDSIFTAKHVYQDLSNAHAAVIATSICQVSLLSMYIWSLISAAPPNFSDPTTYGFYALGTFIQFSKQAKEVAEFAGSPEFAGSSDESNVPSAQNIVVQFVFSEFSFWFRVIEFADSNESVRYRWLGDNSGNTGFQVSTCFSTCYRAILSILINYCGKQIELFLLPIQLAHSKSAMEFLFTSVAAYFIIDMDNYAVGKKIELKHQNNSSPNGNEYVSHAQAIMTRERNCSARVRNGIPSDVMPTTKWPKSQPLSPLSTLHYRHVHSSNLIP